MAKGKDILGMYGPDARTPKAGRAKGGGRMPERDVMNYAEPFVPGWDHHGTKAPGLGGVNYGNCGTQGPKSIMNETSGEAGLRGRNKGMGTNRG